jgi:hemin uptake protein HemP
MHVTANKLFNFVDGAVERLLQRLFPCGYPLQPIFVEKAIEKAIAENTKVFKNGVLPPNKIHVLMNSEDYEGLRKIEAIFTAQLERTASEFIENEFSAQAMATSKPALTIRSSAEQTKGEVEITVEHDETAYEMRK